MPFFVCTGHFGAFMPRSRDDISLNLYVSSLQHISSFMLFISCDRQVVIARESLRAALYCSSCHPARSAHFHGTFGNQDVATPLFGTGSIELF